MNMEQILLLTDILTLFSAFLAVVYVSGIVWRVERDLDVSYKLFLAAILAFLFGEVVGIIFPSQGGVWMIISKGSILVFSILFLAGVWRMRDMVRHLDGEK